MEVVKDLEILLSDKSLPENMKAIAMKVAEGQRISNEDALLLFEEGSLGFTGSLANYIREKKHGIILTLTATFISNLPIFACIPVLFVLTPD
jgi:aminodeoxyfutalosine synthase